MLTGSSPRLPSGSPSHFLKVLYQMSPSQRSLLGLPSFSEYVTQTDVDTHTHPTAQSNRRPYVNCFCAFLPLYRPNSGEESTCNAGDVGLIPGSGRSSGEGNGNPLQYSCLENSGQRSLMGYSPWGCKELDTTECTRTYASLCTCRCLCPFPLHHLAAQRR